MQDNLEWELKLPVTETLQLHKAFVRPLALWPHLETFDATMSPEFKRLWFATPLVAYGPDDFAVLATDESKRDVFMAAYRHSIVPQMRTASDLMMSKRHLLDYQSPTYLDGLFAASGIDWTKLLGGTIGMAAVRYAEHADVWLPIISMWEWEEY